MLHLFIQRVLCAFVPTGCSFSLCLVEQRWKMATAQKSTQRHKQVKLETNACVMLTWLDWRASAPSDRQAWKTAGSSRRETSNIHSGSPITPPLAVAASTLPWHHRLGDTAAIISILQLYLKPALIKISPWTAVKQKLLHKDLFQHFLFDLCYHELHSPNLNKLKYSDSLVHREMMTYFTILRESEIR